MNRYVISYKYYDKETNTRQTGSYHGVAKNVLDVISDIEQNVDNDIAVTNIYSEVIKYEK